MSSFRNTPHLDNLLLQTLMGRIEARPNNTSQTHLLNQTLEDLLFHNLNLSETDSDQNHVLDSKTQLAKEQSTLEKNDVLDSKTQLAKEESRLEKEIIRKILSGNVESLKANSGQAVTINEHHICVGFHKEVDSGYRVWEWHGHIMLFDDENDYSPEYIYGNYFERVRENNNTNNGVEEEKEEEEVEVEEKGSMGLRELIGFGDELGSGRILHRNRNAGSPRF